MVSHEGHELVFREWTKSLRQYRVRPHHSGSLLCVEWIGGSEVYTEQISRELFCITCARVVSLSEVSAISCSELAALVDE